MKLVNTQLLWRFSLSQHSPAQPLPCPLDGWWWRELNITMARVAIINYADEALHHNPIVRWWSRCRARVSPEYMNTVNTGSGNINTEYSVTISRAINIIVIHNNPLTKLGEGDQLSTLALNYSQPPLTPESKVRSDYKIRWKGGKILTNCHTSVLKYISKFSNSNV